MLSKILKIMLYLFLLLIIIISVFLVGDNLLSFDFKKGLNYGSRPVFNNTGNKILISLQYPDKVSQIYEIDLHGVITKKFFSSEYNNSMAIYSPDNSKIAYVQYDNLEDGSSIFIYDFKTKTSEVVTKYGGLNQQPNFSNDGCFLIFQRATELVAGHMGGNSWRGRDLAIANLTAGNKIIPINVGLYYRINNPSFLSNSSILYMIMDADINKIGSSLYKYELDSKKISIISDYNISNFLLTKKNNFVFTIQNQMMYEKDIEKLRGTTFVFYSPQNKTEKKFTIPLFNIVSFDITSYETTLVLLNQEPTKREGVFSLYLYSIPKNALSKIELKDGNGKKIKE